MYVEHEIVEQVYAAKTSSLAADDLVRQYMPFIRAETAKQIQRPLNEDADDELSIAMFAFHEAVMSYQRGKGAFLPYAARAIRNRIIDYARKEQRHTGLISLHHRDESDDRELLEQLDAGQDQMEEYVDRTSAQNEIAHFVLELSQFGLSLTDIADDCPKQLRTRHACHRALAYARKNPALIQQMLSTGKLPITQLAIGSFVERKTLERHRRYMIALLLAYTNGFEIIRGHLRQIAPEKGV